jgi:peptidoglycan/xylan/chitin deacetylase (PgdA/CDA1 family)
MRDQVRDMALRGLSIGKRIDTTDNWLRFPLYHHVFDDERAGFERQLRVLRQFGEFVSLDDAVEILESNAHIDGRFFCLTFDDGFKSCLTGALPVLNDVGAPATFYVVTSLIGNTLPPDDPIARNVFDFKGEHTSLDFLSWEDCLTLVNAGMTIGSHTQSHPRLATLTEADVIDEMKLSKAEIENHIGQPCLHFCAPYGLASSDFNLERDPELARLAGYRSFVTGHRGSMRQGDNPFAIQRDQLMANWGDHQLRYFFADK